MREITLKFILLIILVIFLSIGSISIANAKDKIDVFVSIPPQAYLVERVGGDRVAVHVLVEPGRSPHTFEPTPKQMTQLARADVYFKIGLPIEAVLLEKISGIDGRLRIVDTTSGIKRRTMTGHNHSHAHDEGGTADPHLWLNPLNAGIMASAVTKALENLDSENAQFYKRNAKLLISDLENLRGRIISLLRPFSGKPFFVYHPAFGYFADAFGIVQVPIEVDGKEPGGSELVGLIKAARAHGAKTIFVEPEFSKARARMVANAIDGRVVILDPLARDYVVNLESMSQKISQALAIEKK